MEPSTYKVASLVDKCASGEFLLPEIQRGFVWKRTQVRDLVDSLYRDYPTGSILAWEAENPPKAKPIGDHENNHNSNVELLILDGQQRLTALYWVFGNKINGKHANILFNLNQETFETSSSRRNDFPYVLVSDVLQHGAVATVQQMNLLNDPDFAKFLTRLNKLERIKEYTYQVYVLRRLSYEQVTDIFQRVNSKGTRLQQSELAIAQLAFSLPGLVSDKMQKFVGQIEKEGFRFKLPFVIRCLQAILEAQKPDKKAIRADFNILQNDLRKNYYSEKEINEAWKATANAIERMVNILKNSLGIQSSQWLTSDNALVVPVLYLSQVGHPDISSMLKWLMYALMWGRYSGAAETALDQDYELLMRNSPPSFGELIKSIRREVKETDLQNATIKSPFRIMLYLVCRGRGAKDWSEIK